MLLVQNSLHCVNIMTFESILGVFLFKPFFSLFFVQNSLHCVNIMTFESILGVFLFETDITLVYGNAWASRQTLHEASILGRIGYETKWPLRICQTRYGT